MLARPASSGRGNDAYTSADPTDLSDDQGSGSFHSICSISPEPFSQKCGDTETEVASECSSSKQMVSHDSVSIPSERVPNNAGTQLETVYIVSNDNFNICDFVEGKT